MNRASLCLIAVFAISLLASPAHADWQYTKWGMTKQEALTASQGKATEIPSDKVTGRSTKFDRCLVEQTYTAGTLNLRASLCFALDSDKLIAVHLHPVEENLSQCSTLLDGLQKKYGPSTASDGVLRWKDGATTSITYNQTTIGDHVFCQANYNAVETGETQGL